MKDMNSPRCPVCNQPLNLWVTAADVVRAQCPNNQCSWEWKGG
jgi:hypothetical protein